MNTNYPIVAAFIPLRTGRLTLRPTVDPGERGRLARPSRRPADWSVEFQICVYLRLNSRF
jgi:hypothetical protein